MGHEDKEVGRPAAASETADHPNKISLPSRSDAAQAAAEYTRLLGFESDDRISLCHTEVGASFRSTVVTVADLPHAVKALPERACVWIGSNPPNMPAGSTKRGSAADIARRATLFCEVDFKGGVTIDDARRFYTRLAELFWPPVIVNMTGHGVHIGFQIADGTIRDEYTRDDDERLRGDFQRMVEAIAAEVGIGKQDNLSDLPRIVRLPGTTNWKVPDEPVPCALKFADERNWLTIDIARQRIAEALASVTPPPSQMTNSAPRRPLADVVTDAGPDHPYIVKAINDEIAELAACPASGGKFGGRQNHANRTALKTGKWHQVDREYLRGRIWEACRVNGLTDKPGVNINAQIDSGFRFADACEPRTVPADDREPLGSTDFGLSPLTGGAAAGTDPFAGFMAGDEFIYDIPETVPCVWGRDRDALWIEGESLMVAGSMGLGKTTLAGQLMRAQMGIGSSTVLGLPVRRVTGRILYLAMDRPAQARRAMARQFDPKDREIVREHLVVWPGPPPSDIAQNPALLTRLAELANAEVVYLDSVKDAAVGLSEDAVGAGYNRARQLLMKSGRQLCELHHTTKRGAGGGAPSDAADIYGSTWITNGTGSIIMLTGQPGDPIVDMRHVRQPMNEVGPWQLLHDQDRGEISVDHEIDPVELARLLGAEGLTARAFALALLRDPDGKPTRGQIEKARRRLDKVVDAGLLTKAEGERGGADGGAAAAYFPVTASTVQVA